MLYYMSLLQRSIRNIELKIFQYADDTQIIVSNDSSITEVFRQLRLYEEATGVKINIGKTEGQLMGKWKNRYDTFGLQVGQ